MKPCRNPACHHRLADDEQFCGQCGTRADLEGDRTILITPWWRRRLVQHRTIVLGCIILSILLLLLLLRPVFTLLWPSVPVCSPTTVATSFTLTTLGAQNCQGEDIGVSDGRVAFDTFRSTGAFKLQAAAAFQQGDIATAMALWHNAADRDSSDAEALIYRENQRIATSPHFTIVVGTTITGDDINARAIGRENLQGAYAAQIEWNTNPANTQKVYLLIANSGSHREYATGVAQQIVNLAHNDPHIVGVMGWSLTAHSLNAYLPLVKNQLPLVSTSGGDALTRISPYFFRVAAPASQQANIGASYAWRTLQAKTAVILSDPKNDYTVSLANAFEQAFTDLGGRVLATMYYTVGQPSSLPSLSVVLQNHPDLLYFAGYPLDASTVFANLPANGPNVLGGNALYQLGGYDQTLSLRKGMVGHLYFTALAYHDEWSILAPKVQTPPFFALYKQTYDPHNRHPSSYGYDLADSGVILSYDATHVLLLAARTAQASVYPTGSSVQQALAAMTGQAAYQGVSGQISFGSDGNPINKVVTVVCFTSAGYFKMSAADGQFLVGQPSQSQQFGGCHG